MKTHNKQVYLSLNDKSINGNMADPELGRYLKKLRMDKDVTLHQVSRQTDIDTPMLSKIERGSRLPTLDQIKKLSKYFNISIIELTAMRNAEKIIEQYGVSKATFGAIQLVKERLVTYLKKSTEK